MTDKVDASACRHCGRTALFDGVDLLRVKHVGFLDEWECATTCEKNRKKRKSAPVTVRKERVCYQEVWSNGVLEGLAKRLALRTANLEHGGNPAKTACPKHYPFDIMIPMAHASRHQPLGLWLFSAKYLLDPQASQVLRQHIAAELHTGTDRGEALVNLVFNSYCHGHRVSVRGLRRVLATGHKNQRACHARIDRLLNNLHAVEEDFARVVKGLL